jgi:CRP/FNR family transcriptional regulator, anaerobic regulatory protein
MAADGATQRAACGQRRAEGSSRCEGCEIRSRAFCAAFDDAELTALEAVIEMISLNANSEVFFEGDTADYMYNVNAGMVKIFKSLQDGRRQILGFPVDGDLLGYPIGDSHTYSAETLTRVQLCRVSRARLRDLASGFPALERKLLEIMAGELADSQAQMTLLGRKSAPERVASFLVHLSDKSIAIGGTGVSLSLPMSRHDIADFIGLTAETVSRVLTQLTRDGLIAIPQPYQVNLIRIESLRDLAAAESLDLK